MNTRDESREMATDIIATPTAELTHSIRVAPRFARRSRKVLAQWSQLRLGRLLPGVLLPGKLNLPDPNSLPEQVLQDAGRREVCGRLRGVREREVLPRGVGGWGGLHQGLLLRNGRRVNDFCFCFFFTPTNSLRLAQCPILNPARSACSGTPPDFVG